MIILPGPKGKQGTAGAPGAPGVVGSISDLYASVYGWNGASMASGWTDLKTANDLTGTSAEGFAFVGAYGTSHDVMRYQSLAWGANKTAIFGLRYRASGNGAGVIYGLRESSSGKLLECAHLTDDKIYFSRMTSRDVFSANEATAEFGGLNADNGIVWGKLVDDGTYREIHTFDGVTFTPPAAGDALWKRWTQVARATFATFDQLLWGAYGQTTGGTRRAYVELIHLAVT